VAKKAKVVEAPRVQSVPPLSQFQFVHNSVVHTPFVEAVADPSRLGAYPVGVCECGGALTASVKFEAGEYGNPDDYYIDEIRCDTCSFVLTDPGWEGCYIGQMTSIDVTDKDLESPVFAAAVNRVAASWIALDKEGREEDEAERRAKGAGKVDL